MMKRLALIAVLLACVGATTKPATRPSTQPTAEQRVAQLERENAKLKARIAALEKQLGIEAKSPADSEKQFTSIEQLINEIPVMAYPARGNKWDDLSLNAAEEWATKNLVGKPMRLKVHFGQGGTVRDDGTFTLQVSPYPYKREHTAKVRGHTYRYHIIPQFDKEMAETAAALPQKKSIIITGEISRVTFRAQSSVEQLIQIGLELEHCSIEK